MTEIKTFNMRVPKDIWLFLKKVAAEQETSMMDIVLTEIKKLKKAKEKKLTSIDTYV